MKIKTLIRKVIYKTRNEKLIDDIQKQKKYFFKLKNSKNIISTIILKLKLCKMHDKILYKYACDITPEAQIGEVIFRHPLGIVIGGGAFIEDGVIIHQNVTFGALRFDSIERRGIMCKQHIKKNTIICAGAKILGDVTIGENCIVGANAVITKNIPDGATVVGYNKIILKSEI